MLSASPWVWPFPSAWYHTLSQTYTLSVHACALAKLLLGNTCILYLCCHFQVLYPFFKKPGCKENKYLTGNKRFLALLTFTFGVLCVLFRQSLPGWKCFCYNQSLRCERQCSRALQILRSLCLWECQIRAGKAACEAPWFTPQCGNDLQITKSTVKFRFQIPQLLYITLQHFIC